MDEALNKSLDDLIKEQRDKKGAGGKKKHDKKPGTKTMGNKIGNKGADRRRKSHTPGKDNVTIVVKNPGRGQAARRERMDMGDDGYEVRGRERRGGGRGHHVPRRAPLDLEKADPDIRVAKLEGDAKWSHDMHARHEGIRPKKDKRQPTTLGTKLFISNLHYDVNKSDIKELFETAGELVKYEIHYDRSGRSEETAEIIYKNREDAEKAQRRYNNVQLDNRPMQIELIEKLPEGTRHITNALSSGITVGKLFGNDGNPRITMDAGRVRGRGSVRSQVVRMQE